MVAMAEEVKAWLSSFESALLQRDVEAATQLFLPEECFWRDLLAFTWNIYTAESQQEIGDMLRSTLVETDHIYPTSSWKLQGEATEAEAEAEEAEAVEDLAHPHGDGGGSRSIFTIIQAFFTFETRTAYGRGHIKLRGGKCWCLLTTMQELKGHGEAAGPRRELGAVHGAVLRGDDGHGGRKTWLEARHDELSRLGRAPASSTQPYCLVIGGGQAGISLGARLRRLRVPTLILDKNPRPGDSWRNRYRSLCLHDPVWFNHMPYIPFPDHWPLFSPKDKLADWLEAYTLVMELVYWGSAECKSARFDPARDAWEVAVIKEGVEISLHPKHLVLATGMSGMPHVPALPRGARNFRGAQCHSSQYKDGRVWAGKRCLVIGSNTSAHDICADLWESGASHVTMVQRSPTHVVRSDTLMSTPGFLLYHEGSKIPTEDTDLIFASVPYKIMHRSAARINKSIAQIDATFYDDLERAGFMHDSGEDGSGLMMLYLRRGSGYYIDVGASELVIKGDIDLKSGVTLKEMKERSVVLSDDTEVEADLVVYATGYESMNGWAAKLISQEVADNVGKCWGLGSNTKKDPGPWERELRNMWKPTQQQGLWFHGGSLQQCRHYSLYLALQIKARMEGIPIHVYGMAKVHHTS